MTIAARNIYVQVATKCGDKKWQNPSIKNPSATSETADASPWSKELLKHCPYPRD